MMKKSELEQSLERVAKTVEAIAEAQRKTEEARIKAEEARIKAEEARIKAEEARIKTEEARIKTQKTVDSLAEEHRKTEKTVEAIAEAQRKAEEARIKAEEARIKAQKTVDSLAEEHRKTEKTVEAIAEEHRKTERIVANVGKQIGDYVNSEGRIIEDEFIEAIEKTKQIGDVHLKDIFVRQRFKDLEYDFVGINSTEVVVGEFKRTMRKRDVHKFYNEKLPRFFETYPEYSHLRLWGMVAARSYRKDVAKHAEGKGFYVLAQDKLGIRQLNKQENVRSIELERKG